MVEGEEGISCRGPLLRRTEEGKTVSLEVCRLDSYRHIAADEEENLDISSAVRKSIEFLDLDSMTAGGCRFQTSSRDDFQSSPHQNDGTVCFIE